MDVSSVDITLSSDGTVSDSGLAAAGLVNFTGLTAIRTVRGLSWSTTVGDYFPLKTLRNTSSTYHVVLTHEDSAAAAEDRFLLPGDEDYVLRPGDSIEVRYDYAASRIRGLSSPKDYRFSIRSWKIYGVSDDTAAFENICKKQFKGHGGRLCLADYSDKVRLERTLELSEANGIERGWEIVGAHSRSTYDGASAPLIEWHGNDSTPVLALNRQGYIRGIKFRPNNNAANAIHTVLEIQNTEGEYVFSNLRLSPISSAVAPIHHGIRILSSIPQNVDLVKVEDSYLMTKAIGIDIAGGQPYGLLCNRVYFASSGNQPGNVHSGIGVRITIGSMSLQLNNCGFGKLSLGIGLPLSAHGPIDIHSLDAEHCKRLIGLYTGTVDSGNNSFSSKVTIRSSRLTQHTTAKAAASENPSIASGDNVYMHFPYAGPVVLDSVECSREGGGGHDPDLHVLVEGSSSFVARASRFWNDRPFRVRGNVASTGHWTIENCEGVLASPDAKGRIFSILDSRSGTRSPDGGSTVVPAGATKVGIAWDSGRVEGAIPDYHVEAVAESGSPNLGITVSNASTHGCTVTLAAAPGANEVRLIWRIKPRRTVAGLVGETAFASDTVRATAAGGGPDDPRWLSAMFRLDAMPTTDQAVVSRHDGSTGYRIYISNGAIRCNTFGGSTSPVITLSAAHVGRTLLTVFTWDETTVRSYLGYVETGSGVASVRPAPPAGAEFLIGKDYGGGGAVNPLTSCTLLAVAGGDTGDVPTASNLKTWCANIVKAGTMVAMSGGPVTSHLWLVDGGATITDDVGSDDITLVSGTATTPAYVIPSFEFVNAGGP